MKLFPYQEEGREFLVRNKRAYLADSMGLGKTVQTLAAATQVDPKFCLVVAPAAALTNWQEETKNWPTLNERFRFVSYASLHQLDPDRMWDLVVLDEAHYCKSPSAKRTRRALRLAARAKRAWLLSGTPMPNHPGELYPVFRYLWPEVCKEIGTTRYSDWLETFCALRPTVYGPKPYAVRPANIPILARHLKRVMLRRTLRDVNLELPPLRVTLHHLPHSPELKKALAENGYADEEVREQQYVSTLRRLLGEAKAPLVAQILNDELAEGQYHKIVVLHHHRSVGSTLEMLLNRWGVVTLNGDTGSPDRGRAIQNFQTDDTTRVMIAQQTSAREGINLTAASEVVLLEPDWTPDMNVQAIKRIHRIGQDSPCRARIFTVKDTLDAAVMGGIQRKVAMQTEVGL